MPRLLRNLCLSTGLALFAAGAALAADPVKQHNSSALWFENWVGLSGATLIVVAPDGTMTEIQTPSGTPVYELDRAEAVDGVYNFELRAATEETVKILNPIDQGRGDAQRDTEAVPYYTTGTFTVERGVIVTPPEVTEEDS